MPSENSFDERVVIWAPTGKDGPLTSEVLSRAGLRCVACRRPEELELEMREGVGLAVLAEEALTPNFLGELVGLLKQQPPWSDLPLIVFTQRDDGIEFILKTLGALGNVTVLERPVRITTLLSAVRSGLRGRRRQYELRDLLERLEEADHRKDEFLAMLGHELRNPLAVIQNALTLLTHDPHQSDRSHKQHDVIDRQLRHLCHLVDDLLDVTRITQGKVVLKRQLVDLRKIVDAATRTLESSDQADRHLIAVSKGSEPVPVNGDPVRLEQILWNLLSNAVKYTPDGGHIWVTVDQDESEARISVRDDGIGIPVAMLPRIFEPFMQLEHSLDRSQGGLGLGLPLVRNLVELHGGSIRAASEGRGHGSQFVASFPVAEASDEMFVMAPPADATANVPVALGTAAPARSLKILVVDDNEDGRETMRELLTSLGHEVELAVDGLSAIATALATGPELALIDIGLPGCDGYEVARKIRGGPNGSSPWLVAMTGYGQPDDRRQALDAGFDRHLVKPVAFECLRSLLREIESGQQHALVS
jgi:two-component system, sensor histidine kinase